MEEPVAALAWSVGAEMPHPRDDEGSSALTLRPYPTDRYSRMLIIVLVESKLVLLSSLLLISTPAYLHLHFAACDRIILLPIA
jgi:hypothetical protein